MAKAKARLLVTQGFVTIGSTEAGRVEEDECLGGYVWDADGSDTLTADDLRGIADLLDKLEADRK